MTQNGVDLSDLISIHLAVLQLSLDPVQIIHYRGRESVG